MSKKSKREKTFDLSTVKFNVKAYNPFELNANKEVQDKAIKIAKEEPNLSPEYYFVKACMDYIEFHNETYMDIFTRRYFKKEIDKRDFNFRKFEDKFYKEMFSANPWLKIDVFEYEDKEESEVPVFDPFEISKDKALIDYVCEVHSTYKKAPLFLYFYEACEDYIMDKCGYEDDLSKDFDEKKFFHFKNEMLKSNPWMDGETRWQAISILIADREMAKEMEKEHTDDILSKL
jgi:hypothetical protein